MSRKFSPLTVPQVCIFGPPCICYSYLCLAFWSYDLSIVYVLIVSTLLCLTAVSCQLFWLHSKEDGVPRWPYIQDQLYLILYLISNEFKEWKLEWTKIQRLLHLISEKKNQTSVFVVLRMTTFRPRHSSAYF